MDLLQQLFASLELLLVTMAVFDIEFRAASMVFTRSACDRNAQATLAEPGALLNLQWGTLGSPNQPCWQPHWGALACHAEP